MRKLLPQSVKVVRDGQLMTLPGEELVPGDLILLVAGDNVPADCRLIFANGIRVNASTITGESLPKARSAEECTEHSAEQSALETKNVLLAGTSLVSGEGRAIVFATGMASEFGKIAHLTQTADKTISHLQIEIARLSRLVAIFATTLGAVFFALGALLGLPFWANLMFAIGIIVANRAGRLAADRHTLAGHGYAAHGPAQCADSPSAGGRNPRFNDGDLQRQDRDADTEPDERAAGVLE